MSVHPLLCDGKYLAIVSDVEIEGRQYAEDIHRGGIYKPGFLYKTPGMEVNNGICLQEPPCTEPFTRWCERTAGETPPPTRLVKTREEFVLAELQKLRFCRWLRLF